MTNHQQLIDYIKQSLQAGQREDQIRKSLRDIGWEEKDINEAFAALEPGKAKASPETIPQYSPLRVQTVSLPGPFALLKRAWEIYKKRWKVFLGILFIAVVLSIPLEIFLNLGGAFAVAMIFKNPLVGIVLTALFLSLAFAVTILAQFWPQLSLLYAIKERDREIGIKASFVRAWPQLISYWWISFLVTIIVLGGFLLFIIPGIIFGIRFTFATYVLVSENLKGMEALRRSRELVKGNWGKVFWRLFAITLFIVLITLPAGFLLEILELEIVPEIFVLGLGVFLAPLGAVYSFLIYEDLRRLKSGV